MARHNPGDILTGDWNPIIDCKRYSAACKNCWYLNGIDTKSNKLIYNSSYYYIGHFSRYVKPGAFRVFCDAGTGSLSATAFLNMDGTCSVIVMNDSDKMIKSGISCKGRYLNDILPEHSITTYVLSDRDCLTGNKSE